jgi:AcrR family transcriptional regulator
VTPPPATEHPVATSRARSGRRLLGREARREAILRAAADTFAKRGYEATSMDEVAAAAGITRLIIYRHFATKKELYDAVLEGVARRLREEFARNVVPGRVAEGSVRTMLEVAREDPAGFTLLWRHAAREPAFSGHADAIRSKVVAGAEALLKGRHFDPGLSRYWAAQTLVALLVEAVLSWLEHSDRGEDQVFLEKMAQTLPVLVEAWSAPRTSP